jgi:hypothetical protein
MIRLRFYKPNIVLTFLTPYHLSQSVRPFFSSHGLTLESSGAAPAPSTVQEENLFNTTTTTCFTTENLNVNHQQEPLVVAAVAVASNDVMAIAAAPLQVDEEKKEDDDSSMIVLARSKRKHTTKQSSEEESNSDEKEEQMQQQEQQQQQQQQRPEDVHQQKVEESLPLGNQDVEMNENNDNDDNDQAAMEVVQQQLQQQQQQVLFAMEVAQQQQQLQQQRQQQQERNPEIPNADPQQRYNRMPAMVSEYSSSAPTGNRSSGASNINGMSTSGSGSGGNNTGSGSNSNQGGSSGSGNDQEGGTSSNGNGSSGSGNDNGKGGSGEELMDNTEESNHHHNAENNREKNNSVENLGISSSSKANVKKMGLSTLSENNAAAPNIGNTFQAPSNLSDQLHHHHQDMKAQRRLSNKSLSQEDSVDKNAVRERKIQDKKRKRMNMRREYEDQMEQEMESSESSNDGRGGEAVLLRPGKPTTLDKAVSFTKTAKLVIKASPPFTVIYTNAAYSRLSGIDSHNATGNPITTLLSLPTQQLSQLDFQKDNQQSIENSTENATTQNQNSSGMNNDQDNNNATSDFNKNHAAAEAAGRARAATSKDDNTEVGIEKLVAASGYNKLNKVNIRHQMLGRNVKVYRSKRNEVEGSNGSSISSSSDSPHNVVACTMSISPIVSIPETYYAAIVPDKDKKGDHHKDNSHQHKSKRRKHHHHNQRQVVSHYVIQLEAYDDDLIKNEAEKESQASLSTKGELRQQRVKGTTMKTGNAQVQNADNEVESSEVSESCKHVSAVA